VPIYEYRCSSCGYQKEYLQKVSDPLLTVCPECNQETFGKMLTAAGFQLKGGGWYVTDFRNNGAKPGAKAAAKETEGAKAGADGASASASKPSTQPPAPAAAPSSAKAE